MSGAEELAVGVLRIAGAYGCGDLVRPAVERLSSELDEQHRETRQEQRIRLALLRSLWCAVHDSNDAPDGWLISEDELIVAVQDMHRPGECATEVELADIRAKVARVEALHRPREEWLSPFSNTRGLRCAHCNIYDWPCPTVRALAAAVPSAEPKPDCAECGVGEATKNCVHGCSPLRERQ